MSEDEIEICEKHGCPLEDFVSSTMEGTEYFTYCPKCEEEFEKYLLDNHPMKHTKSILCVGEKENDSV